MTGVGFAIRPEGLTEIEQMLGGMLGKLEDMSPLMDRIGMALETTTSERWEEGVAPDGAPWKKGRKPTGKTLIESGRLKNSVTHRFDRSSVEIGTNVIYARIHQEGGTIRAKDGGYLKFKLPGLGFVSVDHVDIPARPFLGISGEDEEEIAGQVEDFLFEMAP